MAVLLYGYNNNNTVLYNELVQYILYTVVITEQYLLGFIVFYSTVQYFVIVLCTVTLYSATVEIHSPPR